MSGRRAIVGGQGIGGRGAAIWDSPVWAPEPAVRSVTSGIHGQEIAQLPAQRSPGCLVCLHDIPPTCSAFDKPRA